MVAAIKRTPMRLNMVILLLFSRTYRVTHQSREHRLASGIGAVSLGDPNLPIHFICHARSFSLAMPQGAKEPVY
jgi:hypothetical protein